jgi:hypothetical protein
MDERRRTPRIKDENAVTVTSASGENDIPKEKTIDDAFKDISMLGAKIQTSVRLPIGTILEMDFLSNGVNQQINVIGKVKWGKTLIEDESYEMGVEFYPSKAMQKLEDYVTWKEKYNKTEPIKNKLPPIESANIKIAETKETVPVVHDITIEETKKISPINLDEIKIAKTPEPTPVESGDIKITEIKKTPPLEKSKQWIGITVIVLGSIILIVILLMQFGYIPELDKLFVADTVTNIKLATEVKAIPAPEVKPVEVTAPATNTAAVTTQAPVAAPNPTAAQVPASTPTATPAPAPVVAQKIKVIGNSDSKKYHLPGMKYYDSVKAYHRVEFDSEADAIKAGYHKAPQ